MATKAPCCVVCLCMDEDAKTKSAAGGGGAAATLNFVEVYGLPATLAALCTAHKRTMEAGRQVVREEILS